ncbi:MAG TPA: HAD-IB family phosphatase [Coxiellaceae bacterium]|nr:HAD-IB family phosphatase [Coxiellaceae bacterium]
MHFDAIVFDCDGTLSAIEGINQLAAENQVGEAVARLTEEAMSRTGISAELYETRLTLVKPTLAQVQQLGNIYFEKRTSDIVEVMKTLKNAHQTVYIVSAGPNPAVQIFGAKLGVAKKDIFAVDIYFDEEGHYRDFDRDSPMTRKGGKREIIRQLQHQHASIAYVGDGMNDLEVKDMVARFIGFGGHYYRKNIQDACEFYMTDCSMKPLLTRLN